MAFGKEFKIMLDDRIDDFTLFLIINYDTLKLCLSSDKLNGLDKKGFNYFLKTFKIASSKMVNEDKTKLLVGVFGKNLNPKLINKFFNSSDQSIVSFSLKDKRGVGKAKYNLVPYGDSQLDKEFIYDLINFLNIIYDKDGLAFHSAFNMIDVDYEYIVERELFYSCIFYEISNNIAMRLHKKGIYILDNASKIDKLDKIYTDSNYHFFPPVFCDNFGDLLPLFIINPMAFINIVGKKNEAKDSITINVGLIEAAYERYMNKKALSEKNENDDNSPPHTRKRKK